MSGLVFVKRLWALVLLPPTLLGIWLLPADIAASSSEDVVEPWQRLLAMFDQTTLLWVFAISSASWIIWAEIRPFIRRWRNRPPAFRGKLEEHLTEDRASAIRDISRLHTAPRYEKIGGWRRDCDRIVELLKVIGVDDEAEGYASSMAFYHEQACLNSVVRSTDFLTQERYFGLTTHYSWRRDWAGRHLIQKLKGERVDVKVYEQAISDRMKYEANAPGFAGQIQFTHEGAICLVGALPAPQSQLGTEQETPQ